MSATTANSWTFLSNHAHVLVCLAGRQGRQPLQGHGGVHQAAVCRLQLEGQEVDRWIVGLWGGICRLNFTRPPGNRIDRARGRVK